VLYLSISPDGQTIVTGAGDETLRFWNVFPPTRGTSPSLGFSISLIYWLTLTSLLCCAAASTLGDFSSVFGSIQIR
jgi:WD40 repeat protein